MSTKKEKDGKWIITIGQVTEADGDWLRATRLKCSGKKEDLEDLKRMEENILVELVEDEP